MRCFIDSKFEQCTVNRTDPNDGKKQYECLDKKGVLLDFGEIPTRIRREIQTVSKQCWYFLPADYPCADYIDDSGMWWHCHKRGVEIKQVQTCNRENMQFTSLLNFDEIGKLKSTLSNKINTKF